MRSSSSPASGHPAIWLSASNAVVALLLPPPSPAPSGIRFSSEKCAPPFHPVASANARAARNTRFVSSISSVGSSHSSENPSARVSTFNVSPNSTGAATDTRS